MKRYLIASLVAGAVYALLGPVFVHFVLTREMEQELTGVLQGVVGGEGGMGQGLLHVAVRLLFGFVTVALLALLGRRGGRFRAAFRAGLVFWALGYVLWPLYLAFGQGLSVLLLFVCIGYGFCETQLAAFAGALAWGRSASPASVKPATPPAR